MLHRVHCWGRLPCVLANVAIECPGASSCIGVPQLLCSLRCMYNLQPHGDRTGGQSSTSTTDNSIYRCFCMSYWHRPKYPLWSALHLELPKIPQSEHVKASSRYALQRLAENPVDNSLTTILQIVHADFWGTNRSYAKPIKVQANWLVRISRVPTRSEGSQGTGRG